jgi:hypothetical protein
MAGLEVTLIGAPTVVLPATIWLSDTAMRL